MFAARPRAGLRSARDEGGLVQLLHRLSPAVQTDSSTTAEEEHCWDGGTGFLQEEGGRGEHSSFCCEVWEVP